MNLDQSSWKTEDDAVRFEFIFENHEVEGLRLSLRLFWSYRPQDVYQIPNADLSEVVRFDHVFPWGDRIYGFIKAISFYSEFERGDHAIWGDFFYRHRGKDLGHFEGVMLTFDRTGAEISLPSPQDDALPTPASPSEPTTTQPSVGGEDGTGFLGMLQSDLFPYIYLRGWQDMSETDRVRHFVWFDPDLFELKGSFYQALEETRKNNDKAARSTMEATARDFLTGQDPWQGQAISHPGQLPVPLRSLGALDPAKLPQREQLLETLASQSPEGKSVSDQLTSEEVREGLFMVWQTYFALVIAMGYRASALAFVTAVLRIAHALHELENSSKTLAESSWNALCSAPVVLPEALFPLPVDPPLSAKEGWIETFALGDLQMVKQHLIGYEPGEIARVINLLRGERKQVVRRKLDRAAEASTHQRDDGRDREAWEGETHNNLEKEVLTTLTDHLVKHEYNGFDTSYGPPTTATLNGAFQIATVPQKPGKEDIASFAKEILDKTINRLSHRVREQRFSSHLHETEETETCIFDNSHGDANLIGIYRWLNKVFRAHVVQYGHRLMVEFSIPQPASELVNHLSDITGRSLEEPQSLSEAGVKTFADLNETNYASLAASYQVTEIEPPPDQERRVGETLQNEMEKLLPVPEGYQAVSAKVGCVLSGDRQDSLDGLVGTQAFKFAPGDAKPVELTLDGQDGSVPLVLLSPAQSGDQNDQEPAAEVQEAGRFVITVEMRCQLSTRALSDWQIKTYAALQKGYERMRGAYDQRTGLEENQRTGRLLPLPARRRLERREIKQACKRLLSKGYRGPEPRLQGDSWGSAPLEMAYGRAFEAMFEWEQMTYTLQGGLAESASDQGEMEASHTWEKGGAANDDRTWAHFLQAESARVLVPVRPDFEHNLLFFLNAGSLWHAPPQLAPIHAADAPLVNELTMMARQDQTQRADERTWCFSIPTNMQVLDERNGFLPKGRPETSGTPSGESTDAKSLFDASPERLPHVETLALPDQEALS